ncbi:probable G-protein coupled receptor 139 [Heterodontus francisci]|uniref:probable G-protein coupled receptor 139 n=1 Tax=Heterodontus francisci TaxID=7792 RepID=UPI00355B80A2
MTIVILYRGKCGLSKCVTRYLVTMAVMDLLVVFLDLILRHIPIVYREHFRFMNYIRVCNIHAVLLYAITDCSVWATVTFTFDRFVAISSQKLKRKYCTERIAAVVLGTVIVLCCLSNIFWYFVFKNYYPFINFPWFCYMPIVVMRSFFWLIVIAIHHLLNPALPFILILLLNVFTVRNILVSSRARRRLRGKSIGDHPKDPEMESRRKSIILLFVISWNFILLWAVFALHSIWYQMFVFGYDTISPPDTLNQLGFMLQQLSCCTNTFIYAVMQTKIREQMKDVVKYPFKLIVKVIKM